MVKVRLHGVLGKALKQKEWQLDVSSASEALYAINVNTDFKLRKILLNHQKQNIKYGVLINKNQLRNNGEINKNNSIFLRYEDLKTVDTPYGLVDFLVILLREVN